MTKINLTKEQFLERAELEDGVASVAVGKLPDNCMDCTHHKVVRDPDPTDWFCDDDVAVLCQLMPPAKGDTAWASGQQFQHRAVTISCRPHKTRDESKTPAWCPIRPLPPK
jgi:hypothetical protein